MRTTLTIDDDLLAAGKRQAEREHRTVGDVISTLARGGRYSLVERNGIPLLPSETRAAPATLELVNQLRDEQP